MSDVPAPVPVSSSTSAHTANRTSRTSSFFDFLAKASGEETHVDSQHSQLREQTATREDGAQRTEDQTQSGAPIRQDRAADHSAGRHDSREDSGKNSASGTQSASQAGDSTSRVATNDISATPVQQVNQTQTSDADQTSNDVTLTISVTGSGDDMKVSVDGLSEELLNALLAACNAATGMIRFEGAANAAQPVSAEDNKADKSQGLESEGRDDNGKVTSKVSLDASDMTNAAKELLALLQGLIEALQNKAQNTVTLQLDVADASNSKTYDSKILEVISDTVQKGTSGGSAHARSVDQVAVPAVNQTINPAVNLDSITSFRDLLSRLSVQASQPNAEQPGNLAQSVSSDSIQDVKPVKETAVSIAELVMAKIKSTVTVPDIEEETPNTRGKEVDLPSQQGGSSSLAGQNASLQATVQQQEPPTEASGSASFGSIVADRLAAVAEQVSTREKPLDITLRLRMENGESLMVGLKDQAGRVIVQVKSADQNMIGFLESQKETIVRNLEAKQVSSTISVSPIEEDLAKRQPREQQQRNTWGRRHEPANPFIETSV